jgi:hypothetical protein
MPEEKSEKIVLKDKKQSNKKPQKLSIRRTMSMVSTLIKNSICLGCWVWLVCRIVQPTYRINWDFLSQWSLVTLLFYGACLFGVFAVIITDKPWRIRFWGWQLFRLMFFPIIAVFHFFYLPYKAIKITRTVLQNIDKVVFGYSSASLFIHLFVILIASIIYAIYGPYQVHQQIAVGLATLALIADIRFAFRWASQPLEFIEHIVAWLVKNVNSAIEKDLRKTENTNPENKVSKQKEFLKQVSLNASMVSWIKKRIERNTERKIFVKQFVVMFIIVFSIAVCAYGVVYHSLSHLGYFQFGDQANHSFLDYVFYSLLVITTSANLSLGSGLFQVFIATEIFFGIGLLTLLVLQFSTVSLEEASKEREQLLALLSDRLEYLNSLLVKFTNNNLNLEIKKPD